MSHLLHRCLHLFTLCCAAILLAACSPEPLEFHGSDISGTGLGSDMAIPDTSGQLRTIKDYRGKVVVVFFGFTQCPDVCPTALAELAHTMDLLEEDADDVQVLLISVDPERDTPEILSQYMASFNPSFVGLRGDEQQLNQAAQSFKAYYAKAPGPNPDDYTMDHSASFYVFDKKGEVRILLSGDSPAEEIADDIRLLLKS